MARVDPVNLRYSPSVKDDGVEPAPSRSQTVVLVGVGHVHLYVAAHAGKNSRECCARGLG